MDTSKLTEAELDEFGDLLKKLGVLPKEKKKSKKQLLPEYGLKAITTCSLCGFHSTEYFLMKSKEEAYLQNVTINKNTYEVQELRKTAYFNRNTCPRCTEFLSSFEKDTLVKMILEKHKR
jgi:hypothetical protein